MLGAEPLGGTALFGLFYGRSSVAILQQPDFVESAVRAGGANHGGGDPRLIFDCSYCNSPPSTRRARLPHRRISRRNSSTGVLSPRLVAFFVRKPAHCSRSRFDIIVSVDSASHDSRRSHRRCGCAISKSCHSSSCHSSRPNRAGSSLIAARVPAENKGQAPITRTPGTMAANQPESS